jgi:endonuclease YncB( thermonuclease family)
MARKKRAVYVMSRTQKNALIAAFFFFIIPLAVLTDGQLLRPVRKAISSAVWSSEDRKRYHDRIFTVSAVVDGDTLNIDAADGTKTTTIIRLIGVDTPETKHPTVGPMFFGQEATDYTRRLSEGQQVTVRLDTISDERDRYGRLLAYITLPDGHILNEELIRNGYGYADLRFLHGHFDTYVELMNIAMTQKKGLWDKVNRKQLPQWLQRKRPELLR